MLMRSYTRSVLSLVSALVMGIPVATSSSADCLDSKRISLEDFAAFSRVLAEDPLNRHGPVNVRLVVYAHPHECPESSVCENMNLLVAVIGDGEAPDYKVYDLGNAVNWKFVRWRETPTSFHDDDRDAFVFELEKATPCNPPDCETVSSRTSLVHGRVSLSTFRWVDQ